MLNAALLDQPVSVVSGGSQAVSTPEDWWFGYGGSLEAPPTVSRASSDIDVGAAAEIGDSSTERKTEESDRRVKHVKEQERVKKERLELLKLRVRIARTDPSKKISL
jgi:hypothetical protein